MSIVRFRATSPEASFSAALSTPWPNIQRGVGEFSAASPEQRLEAIFSAALSTPWPTSQRGVRKPYQRACITDDRIERAFLTAGFRAWLAYILVVERAFHGLDEQRSVADALPSLDEEKLKEIATRVDTTTPHPDNPVNEMEEAAKCPAGQKRKRQDAAESSSYRQSAAHTAIPPSEEDDAHDDVDHATPQPAEERRADIPPAQNQPRNQHIRYHHNLVLQHAQASNHQISNEQVGNSQAIDAQVGDFRHHHHQSVHHQLAPQHQQVGNQWVGHEQISHAQAINSQTSSQQIRNSQAGNEQVGNNQLGLHQPDNDQPHHNQPICGQLIRVPSTHTQIVHDQPGMHSVHGHHPHAPHQLCESQPEEDGLITRDPRFRQLLDVIFPREGLSRQYQVVTYADILAIRKLLPLELSMSVKLDDFPERSLATVLMLHPRLNHHSKQAVCYMALEMIPYRVERLAKAICGVNIEIYNGFYELLIPGILRLTPSEYLVMRGSTKKDFAELFGPQIAHAIRQAPLRQAEVRAEAGTDDFTTKCVRLMVPRKPASPSFIILALHPSLGFGIAQDLMVVPYMAF